MKKFLIVISMCILIFSFAALAGCSAQNQKNQTTTNLTEMKIASTPSLQPAGHQGRFEEGGVGLCYGCHGAGDLANPMLKAASIMPEDHYVNNSYGSQKISVDRYQCISCHPVA